MLAKLSQGKRAGSFKRGLHGSQLRGRAVHEHRPGNPAHMRDGTAGIPSVAMEPGFVSCRMRFQHLDNRIGAEDHE